MSERLTPQEVRRLLEDALAGHVAVTFDRTLTAANAGVRPGLYYADDKKRLLMKILRKHDIAFARVDERELELTLGDLGTYKVVFTTYEYLNSDQQIPLIHIS